MSGRRRSRCSCVSLLGSRCDPGNVRVSERLSLAEARPAQARLDERLEAGRRDWRVDLGERAADQAEVHGADDVAVLLGEVAERAAVHEDVAVLPLGLEAVLVEQADDLVGGVGGRQPGEGRRPLDEEAAPGLAGALGRRGAGLRAGERAGENGGEQPVVLAPRRPAPRPA